MDEVFKVPAPVGKKTKKRRSQKRPLSPKPSTSCADEDYDDDAIQMRSAPDIDWEVETKRDPGKTVIFSLPGLPGLYGEPSRKQRGPTGLPSQAQPGLFDYGSPGRFGVPRPPGPLGEPLQGHPFQSTLFQGHPFQGHPFQVQPGLADQLNPGIPGLVAIPCPSNYFGLDFPGTSGLFGLPFSRQPDQPRPEQPGPPDQAAPEQPGPPGQPSPEQSGQPQPEQPGQQSPGQPGQPGQQPQEPFVFPNPKTEAKRILDLVLHSLQFADSARRAQFAPIYYHQNPNNGRMSGVQSGRRRRDRLWNRYRQLKLEQKQKEYAKILEPLLLEEVVNQQQRHVLIETALSGFADTINHIADKLEGKPDKDYEKYLEQCKKKENELREQQQAFFAAYPEFSIPLPPKLTEEELNKRLREETKAAVEAILKGDPKKEAAPNNFAKVFEQLRMV